MGFVFVVCELWVRVDLVRRYMSVARTEVVVFHFPHVFIEFKELQFKSADAVVYSVLHDGV